MLYKEDQVIKQGEMPMFKYWVLNFDQLKKMDWGETLPSLDYSTMHLLCTAIRI